ncbi:MAG: tRNA uridine-5-carboxymethylaminomethyl(34) synthesis GTPase MnmE [Bacteroidales bacterium]|nr:tRNA uridine-5-carboxymethylaminomethyl(34) synthesis GTPase MnmE [Bacteroidales bacterium]
MQPHFENTICAPASARGGAIAVVRVSGPDAISCVDRIFSGRAPLADAPGYSLHFGSIREADGAPLDEVVVSVFRAPRSYTGENAAEIACHGSDYIVSRILALLCENGAQMAAPGEFTQRAFVRGKMDLSQAEAVADLIAAQTAAAHRIAFKQLKGGFSEELAGMRAELLHLASLMELELDFGDEEVEFADRSQLRELVEKVLAHCEKLIESFRLGNAIKNGVPVAIVGNTNSGKSTLLNALLGENRAIVSDIAGTTRDTIEETCNLDGVLFRFIDTAGLRQSDDTIERIGIERAYEKLSAAQLVLAMLDLTQPLDNLLASASHIAERATDGQQLVFLLNKADAVPVSVSTAARRAFSPLLAAPGRRLYTISAKAGLGLEDLRHALAATWRDLDTAAETSLVTNARHLAALQNAATALRRVRDGLGSIPTDLLAQDLRESLYHLGSITGEITPDEVLGNIFRNFCIGK